VFDYWRLKTGRLTRDLSAETQRIMQRGLDLEPEAARAYADIMQCELETVGIIVHPSIPWIHCSPDRLIHKGFGEGGVGIVELKCPMFGLPLRIKDQYKCQVIQQMAVTGAEWCDLVFYYRKDDQEAGQKQVAIYRIWMNDEYWHTMLDRMGIFADALMVDKEPAVSLRPTMPKLRIECVYTTLPPRNTG